VYENKGPEKNEAVRLLKAKVDNKGKAVRFNKINTLSPKRFSQFFSIWNSAFRPTKSGGIGLATYFRTLLIPAKAGIHSEKRMLKARPLDSRCRGNDCIPQSAARAPQLTSFTMQRKKNH